MGDMATFIAPKSDQLTADDLLSGERVIRITEVRISPGTEQPCKVYFEGDNGKPWCPCKSMGRVLVNAWGPDSSKYVGKSLLIFRDPDVTWAGMKVGGIRVKALSNIPRPFDMALTETRGKKAIARFHPLKDEPAPAQEVGDPAAAWVAKFTATLNRAPDSEKLEAYIAKCAGNLTSIEDRDDLRTTCEAAMAEARAKFTTETDDPFGEEV